MSDELPGLVPDPATGDPGAVAPGASVYCRFTGNAESSANEAVRRR